MSPRTIAVALLMTSSSCSAYGWANRPGSAVTTRTVAVHTVDVDASADADAGYLTRTFVASLQHAGVPGAAWTTSTASAAVACDVAVEDDVAFGDAWRVLASAQCVVNGQALEPRQSSSQIATTGSRRADGRARAAQTASTQALHAAALGVADHLARLEPKP